MDGLIDWHLSQISRWRALVDEVLKLVDRYRSRHADWNVKHYYTWYRKDGGTRSYTWVKSALQKAGVVKQAPQRGAHRRRRERAPLTGMLIHQDGSTHEWVPGQKWDLIVTMDDADSDHYSMFFTDQEGTVSSVRGVHEVIEKHGLFRAVDRRRPERYIVRTLRARGWAR